MTGNVLEWMDSGGGVYKVIRDVQSRMVFSIKNIAKRSLQNSSVITLACFIASAPAIADEYPPMTFERSKTLSYNLFGAPGLIDMPTAEVAREGDLAASVVRFGGTTRTNLTFQVTPRLSGSFRYSKIDPYYVGGGALYDRSFDLKYQLAEEGNWRPSIAIGLQDFIGTSVYSGEYLVATKHLTPSFALTGGLGWGRLASYGAFSNPLSALDDHFDIRAEGFEGKGGEPDPGRWFTGDAAFFGGVAWRATDKMLLKAEYSSDDFDSETSSGANDWNSPLNFGVDYQLAKDLSVQGYFLHGEEIGASVTLLFNPKDPPVYGGIEAAPPPVAVRPAISYADLGWLEDSVRSQDSTRKTHAALQGLGLEMEELHLEAHSATLYLRNDKYGASAEAIGRAARILTHTLPASIETFQIVATDNGQPRSMVTLQRSDVEDLELSPGGTEEILARARIEEAPRKSLTWDNPAEQRPRFSWGLAPYLSLSYFDPDQPVRADLGLELSADYWLAPNIVVSGAVRKRLVGNIEDMRESNSVLEHVRTDAGLYASEGDPSIANLTIAHFGRPAPQFYSRVTFGYLETMFAGISGELLWKPVDSRLALGAEVNYVKQRDYDQLFGLQDYEVATGHISAYYDFENGFLTQLDVGRYLAGDTGATLTVEREFKNGFKVGAYATLTDVPFDDFGEGSFDKGLLFTVPFEVLFGSPNRQPSTITLRSLARDGGARLNVAGRLYESVRKDHKVELVESWGKFWR
jgi:hypothetical protein